MFVPAVLQSKVGSENTEAGVFHRLEQLYLSEGLIERISPTSLHKAPKLQVTNPSLLSLSLSLSLYIYIYIFDVFSL